jgi:dTDP-4-dehydrorhamnose reductase
VVAADRAELDLSAPTAIAATLTRLAPDLIVNPAAFTAVDRAEDERELAYLVNAESPGRIAVWAAQRGVPFIHFSTDYVFDGFGTRPWRESDPTGPLSTYGATKLAGELAVRAALGSHLIVRTSWVYAASGTNFLRTITRLLREKQELRIVADQIGAPTSARVIAGAIATILANNTSSLPELFARSDGTVHLACSGETSWYGFAMAIREGLRAREVSTTVGSIVPIRSEDYPTKAQRPRNSRLDLSRLRELFGITSPGWIEALNAELDDHVGELA